MHSPAKAMKPSALKAMEKKMNSALKKADKAANKARSEKIKEFFKSL